MADAGSLLGQLIGAALSGGGVRGGQANAGGGALGDILGQVLGGGGRAGGQAGGQAGQGGLGDILGQVLGGGAAGGAAGRSGGGLGDMVGDALGGPGGAASAPGQVPVPAPQPQHTPAPSGGSQPSSGNDFLKYGGLAVIGMVAFNAFRKWQQSSGARSGFLPDAQAGNFGPAAAPGGAAHFSGTLLAAMTAAAQADGRLDQEELTRITGGLEKIGASGMDQNALIEALTTPVDPQVVISAATSPEAALQIYTASAMAVRADTPIEQQYLANLATALRIDPGLKAQIDRDVGA